MRDDRDDVLHTAPAIKNIVTTVTVVTQWATLRDGFVEQAVTPTERIVERKTNIAWRRDG